MKRKYLKTYDKNKIKKDGVSTQDYISKSRCYYEEKSELIFLMKVAVSKFNLQQSRNKIFETEIWNRMNKLRHKENILVHVGYPVKLKQKLFFYIFPNSIIKTSRYNYKIYQFPFSAIWCILERSEIKDFSI